MRFRNQIVRTIFIQGVGAIALLLAISLLGKFLGPAAQGAYSRLKIEVEFIGALAVIGLPQAMFYYVQSSQMSLHRAIRLANQITLIGGILALFYGSLELKLPMVEIILFVLAAVALIWHVCLRGILLATCTSKIFNIVSATPQCLLLIYAIFAISIGKVDQWQASMALAMAYAATGLMALHAMQNSAISIDNKNITEVALKDVAHYGVASGIAAIGANSSLLITVHAVQNHFGAISLGIFTFALALTQGLLVPLNYTIPLLFKRWMEMPGASKAIQGGAITAMIIASLALIVRLSHDFIDNLGVLSVYSPMLNFLWILILVIAIDAFQKIIAVAANSKGYPWLPACSEALRLISIVSGLACHSVDKIADIAYVLLLSAFVAAGFMLIFYIILIRIKTQRV
jgi:hypothetical protein